MFHVVGNIDTVRPLSKTDSTSRFSHSVTCHDELGFGAFRAQGDPEIRQYVNKWCEENLSSPFLVGHLESVIFSNEEDALLFFMAFK